MTWFYQVNPLEYDLALETYEKMRTGQLKTVELEYLESLVKFSLLDAGVLKSMDHSHLFVIFREELEVTNLRWSSLDLDVVFPLADYQRKDETDLWTNRPIRSQLWANQDAILPFFALIGIKPYRSQSHRSDQYLKTQSRENWDYLPDRDIAQAIPNTVAFTTSS